MKYQPDPVEGSDVITQSLLSTLSSSASSFLQPLPGSRAASLALAKQYLDPLAHVTSQSQEQRQQARGRKRKRVEADSAKPPKPLRVKQIYLQGFGTDQIWAQARRILDASTADVGLNLLLATHNTGSGRKTKIDPGEGPRSPVTKLVPLERPGDNDFEKLPPNDEFNDFGSDDPEAYELDEVEKGTGDNDDDESAGREDSEPDSLHSDPESLRSSPGLQTKSEEVYIPDKLGLDDGFFFIDEFNRQSEFLEQQDARGENDEPASDEDEVDWTADPLAIGTSLSVGNAPDSKADSSADEDSGPTFGNADPSELDQSVAEDSSNDELEMDQLDAINNTNNIKYAEFFAPPPKKSTKSDRRRALPKTQPSLPAIASATEEDIQRTISAVRRDIFEDDLTQDDDSNSDAVDSRSSHQKRQARLTEEIRRLEAAAVAKRDWTLSGEARAADRPQNSLLEEDLEFERVGKPVPVITQEVSEDIEALIKRRILAKEFDEVLRRRPSNLVTSGIKEMRRGRFELENSKPQQSLADLYEADHLKTADPEGYIDKRDEKLKSEHANIEALWKDVSAKLDILSSWHYRPKPPSAHIKVIADVATVSMEDARPAAGEDVGGASTLAPQDIYKAGETRDRTNEVTSRSGLPVRREEMSRDEKIRRRRREKERIRKAGVPIPTKSGNTNYINRTTKDKLKVINDLKKGSVRIIGKKGELRDVEGHAVRKSGTDTRAGGYKL